MMAHQHPLKAVTLTHVRYERGDQLGHFLAWVSLVPVFISLGGFISHFIFRRELQGMFFALGLLISQLVNEFIKTTVEQARPATCELLETCDSHGWPSCYSQYMFFFAVYYTLLTLKGIGGIWKVKLKWAALILPWSLALLTMYSRVYLGYHTLAQVFAGATLGALLGALWFWFVNSMLFAYFPMIEESAFGRFFFVKDTSHIPNVLKFEYDNARAARRDYLASSSSFTLIQKLAIMLIASAGFSSYVHCLSLLTEETGSGLHDTKNPASRYFNTSEKYILKSYFDKYETLEDATFSDFFEHDLLSTMCEPVTNNGNAVVRFSVLRRSLIGEGSHRHLYSSIGLFINPNLEPQTPPHFCDLIITERLPLGVFADPFELQNLQDRGVFTKIAVFGDGNLELPSFRSNRSAVEIQIAIGPDLLLKQSTELEFNIQLPLHARYPPLDESGYLTVKFSGPDLFLRCMMEGDLQNKTCLVFSLDEKINSRNERSYGVTWKVPSGVRAHAGVVSAVTFISALLATLTVAIASLSSPSIKVKKQ